MRRIDGQDEAYDLSGHGGAGRARVGPVIAIMKEVQPNIAFAVDVVNETGKLPPVVDSRDLLEDPEAVLTAPI